MNRLSRIASMLAIMNDLMPQLGRDLGIKTISNKEAKRKERGPKYTLTVEEQATLETLTGKQKKAYVKELKAKYES